MTIGNRALRVALSFGTGVALALAFPDYNLPLIAWFAPAGLIVACLDAGLGTGALCGMAFGTGFYLFSVPWIYTVMRRYGPLPDWQAAIVMALMLCVVVPYFIVLGFAVSWVSRRSMRLAVFASPFLWVAMEWAESRMPSIAFPWNLLGYAAATNLALLQLAAVTGIFGLSFLVVAYSAIVAWLLLSLWQGRSIDAALLALISVTVVLATIAFEGRRFLPPAASDQVAHLVQVDLPQADSYPGNWAGLHARDMQQIRDITVTAAKREPGVVIWSEVPAPFSMQDPAFARRASDIARDADVPFLLGVIDWKRGTGGSLRPYNSAVLLDAQGREQFLYDKIHLVPFSEFVPARQLFWFAKGLLLLVGDFASGTVSRVGTLPGGRFGVFICYESIFPDAVRQFALHGAGVLINISDDGWFGRSAAPAQSLAMARVRAVENRRWLLRDTNNGITASIDPYGRIVARMTPDIRGQLDAPYAFRRDRSLYTLWGDWVAEASTGMSILLLALAVVPGNRSKRGAAGASRRIRKGRKTK